MRILVLWGKKHQNKGETMPCEAHSFFLNWLDTFGTDQDTSKQALAHKLLPSSKSDGFQSYNHNRCDYFCSTIGIDYFLMVSLKSNRASLHKELLAELNHILTIGPAVKEKLAQMTWGDGLHKHLPLSSHVFTLISTGNFDFVFIFVFVYTFLYLDINWRYPEHLPIRIG